MKTHEGIGVVMQIWFAPLGGECRDQAVGQRPFRFSQNVVLLT